jgi:hypothetical protein
VVGAPIPHRRYGLEEPCRRLLCCPLPPQGQLVVVGLIVTVCSVCGCDPCPTSVFCRVSRLGDVPRGTLVSETPPEKLAHRDARERSGEAPRATYDAVFYELREYGVSQLGQANCQRRLADLSIAQLKRLMAGLQQRRAQYPNISDQLLSALGEIWDARIRMVSNGQ